MRRKISSTLSVCAMALGLASFWSHPCLGDDSDIDQDDPEVKECISKAGKKVGQLEVTTEDNGSNVTLTQICWTNGKLKNCQKMRENFLTGLTLECSDTSANVTVSLSANYPMLQWWDFKLENGKIKYLGVTRPESPAETNEKSRKAAIKSLKTGDFGTAFKLFASALDDGCMGIGCRRGPDQEHEDNVSFAKDLLPEVDLAAKSFFKARKYKQAYSAIEAFFTFCLEQGILHPSLHDKSFDAETVLKGDHRKILLERLSDPLNLGFVALANDWGFYLAQAKELAQARPILEAVLRASPDRGVAYLNLGDVLWDTGQKDAAKKQYRSYLAHVTKRPPPRQILQRCAECLK